MTAEELNSLRTRLHAIGCANWVGKSTNTNDDMFDIAQACVRALDQFDQYELEIHDERMKRLQAEHERDCAVERIKEHDQFRHQHRDCDRLAIALHRIKLGPPISMDNDEVAAWAASVANEAFALDVPGVLATPWICANCKSENRDDYHPISCPGCGTVRPALPRPAPHTTEK